MRGAPGSETQLHGRTALRAMLRESSCSEEQSLIVPRAARSRVGRKFFWEICCASWARRSR